MRTMPRTKVGGIFGTCSAKTQHGRWLEDQDHPQPSASGPNGLFDRNREAADQRGDFVQPCRIVRLDGACETGQAFIVTELGDICRQNRGGHLGTVDLDYWHSNQLRKNPAAAKLD
ncbi:hypothetical protein JJE66_19565 [Bradyrhizobium diazoefficiens]|nr:hypothetical protein [Bradyrhizobium diazoefficiens]